MGEQDSDFDSIQGNEWSNFALATTFLKTDKNIKSHRNTADDTALPKIALTSYPRSGNTMIRRYIEKLTHIYTGSDCDLRRKLNK